VALAKASDPAAGSLFCTATTVSAVAGVATFAGCKISRSSAGGYKDGSAKYQAFVADSNPLCVVPRVVGRR
jgi:hypothetical protein